MTIKDLDLDPVNQRFLYTIGARDRARGLTKEQGWQNIASELGYSTNERTLAQLRYEDGWFGVND